MEHKTSMAGMRKDTCVYRCRNLYHGAKTKRMFFTRSDIDCLIWLIRYNHQTSIDEFQEELLWMTGGNSQFLLFIAKFIVVDIAVKKFTCELLKKIKKNA